MKKVSVNGTETAYAYAGSAYDDTESVTYEGKAADKVTVTRGTADPVQAVSYTDKRGNALGAVVDGETQYKNTYNADETLQQSVDEITGSQTDYDYTIDGTKKLLSVEVGAGTNVNALTETYTYNDYGQTATKSLSEAVSQTYVYAYKDNAARDVDYMTLPNGLKYYPQKDVNGRNTGRELTDTNGNRKYGEYIYYRKVGDHATNIPASVYYGMTKNGKYVIGENVKYSYDEMGNISKVFENGTMTVQYTYDALNRLVREDNKKLGKTYFTTYDNCGNILSKRETAYTLKGEEELSEETFTEVLYGYEANSDRLATYNGGAITYDEFGNPTGYRGNTLEWKYGKFLEKYGSTTFVYDGYGRRIKKGNTVFTYDNEGNLVKQSDGTNTLEFMYDGNGLCGVKCNNENYLYRKNAQGDITHILDSTGMVVAKYVYDAWGNHAILDGNGNDLASGVGILNPFRYRGYYYDTETDLYYLQTRYYDPEVGRFISQDDVSYLAPDNINGLNLYAYCGNNPVMATDPTGTTEWWEWLLAGGIVAALVVGSVLTGGMIAMVFTGAAIGAGLSLATQAMSGTLNWGQFALDTVIGGLTGFVGGSSASRAVASIAGGLLGGISSAASDIINGREFNFEKFVASVAIGAFFGFLGGSGANNTKGLAGELFGNANNEIAVATVTYLKNSTSASYLIPAMNNIFNKAMGWYAGGTIVSNGYNSLRGF